MSCEVFRSPPEISRRRVATKTQKEKFIFCGFCAFLWLLLLAKNVGQGLEKFFGGVGFVEEDRDAFQRSFAGAMSGSKATRCDDSYFRIHALEGANRRQAVHEWHHHVSQNNCDLVLLVSVECEGFGAVARGQHRIAKSFQRATSDLAN